MPEKDKTAKTSAPTKRTTSAEDDVSRRRPAKRIVARVALWTGLGLVVAATAYVAVMAIQWHSRVEELTEIQRDLTSALSDAHAEYRLSSDALDDARAEQEDAESDLVALANDKAQAQDFAYRFQDAAVIMAECADAEADAVRILRINHATMYPPRPEPPRWVDDWCWEIIAFLDDLATEAEEVFP